MALFKLIFLFFVFELFGLSEKIKGREKKKVYKWEKGLSNWKKKKPSGKKIHFTYEWVSEEKEKKEEKRKMSFESEQVAVIQSLLAMAPPSSKYVAIPSAWWKAWIQRSRSFSLSRLTGPGLRKLAPKPGPVPPPPPPSSSSSSSSGSSDPTKLDEVVYVVPHSVYCTLVEWHGTTNPRVPFVTSPPTPSQILLADEEEEEEKEKEKINDNVIECSSATSSNAQIIVDTNVETKKVVSKAKRKKGKKKGGKCAKKSVGGSSTAKIESGESSTKIEESVSGGNREEEVEDEDDGGEKIDLQCQVSISSFKEEDQFVLRVPASTTLLAVRKKLYALLLKRRGELEGNFENTVVMGKRFWDPPIMWENLEDEDYELNIPATGKSASNTLEEAGVDDTFRITLAVIPEKRKKELKAKHDEEAQRRKREEEEFERRCRLGTLFMPAEPYAAPTHALHCCNFGGEHHHGKTCENDGNDNKESK